MTKIKATNYYWSSSGNDNAAGTSPATAFQSISKFNAIFSSLINGDSCLFKRGDTFYGTLFASKSFSGAGLVISAYGTGDLPVITGFTNPVTWINESGSIYYTTISCPTDVNLLISNGVIQKKARYPDSNSPNGDGGWVAITQRGNNNTAGQTNFYATATAFPFDPTGGQTVIKFEDWLDGINPVVSQSANQVNFTNVASPNVYLPKIGYGVFLQGMKQYLSQAGEWWYDSVNTRMYYFGNPTSTTIRFSTLETGIDLNTRAFITVENLYVEGFNDIGISSLNTSSSGNIVIKNCTVNYSGGGGITLFQTANSTIQNCNVYNCLRSGIYIRRTGGVDPNANILDNVVRQTARYAGLGLDRDAAGRGGITGYTNQTGSGINILRNKVYASGYIGIEFQGNDVLVQGNLVDSFCLTTQDGGGIYTYVSGDASPTQYSNRKVSSNIILNGIGSNQGTNSGLKARGVYMDEGTNHVIVDTNSIAWISDKGLYGNNYDTILWRNNIVFKTAGFTGQKLSNNANALNGNVVTNNQFFPYNTLITYTPFSGFTFDSSYYYATSSVPVRVGSTNYTFAQWQGTFGQETHAVPAFSQVDSLRFVYNATTSSENVSLGANYQTVSGTTVSSITLGAFRSAVLKYISPLTPPTGTNSFITRKKFINF